MQNHKTGNVGEPKAKRNFVNLTIILSILSLSEFEESNQNRVGLDESSIRTSTDEHKAGRVAKQIYAPRNL